MPLSGSTLQWGAGQNLLHLQHFSLTEKQRKKSKEIATSLLPVVMTMLTVVCLVDVVVVVVTDSVVVVSTYVTSSWQPAFFTQTVLTTTNYVTLHQYILVHTSPVETAGKVLCWSHLCLSVCQ